MADEYIDKVEVGAKIQMMYIRREMDYGGENDKCRADTEGRTSIYRPFWCPLKEEKDRATVYRGD